jgi:hypothetical protein
VRGLVALWFVVALSIACPVSAQDADDVPEGYAAASSVHVTFESEPVSLGISRSDGAGGWEQIGLSPCDVVLASGPIDLALTLGNHAPERIPVTIELNGGERLLGHYESRQSQREWGVGIVIGTLIGVLIGIAISSGGFLAHEPAVGIGALVAAASVGVVGGATGIALATLDDIATLDVL